MNKPAETAEDRKILATNCRDLHQSIEALEKAAKQAIRLGQSPEGALQALAEIRSSLAGHPEDPHFAAALKRCELAEHRLKAHWLRTGTTFDSTASFNSK